MDVRLQRLYITGSEHDGVESMVKTPFEIGAYEQNERVLFQDVMVTNKGELRIRGKDLRRALGFDAISSDM